MRTAMRDADHHALNSLPSGDIQRPAGQHNVGPSRTIIAYFDIAPTDAAYPTSANRFEYGFLRSPTPRIVLRCCFSGGAVFDLVLGIHAGNELLGVSLDHLRNAEALDNIGANSKNFHQLSAGD